MVDEKASSSVGLSSVLLVFLLLNGVVARIARAEGPAIGPLFSIAATDGGEGSLSAAFDGTNFLVAIQGDAQSDHRIGAQLVGPDASLIGSLITTGRTGGFPFVTLGGGNYLMVWSDDATSPNDDIFGQLISTSGALVGSAFPISTDGVALDSGNAYLDNFVVDSGQRAVDDGLQPDPFAGSRTVELYGDDNIKDGIQLDSFHVNLAVSTSDSLHYAADITGDRGGLSLAMTRDGNLLTLDPRPQTTTINSYMFSDGGNGAFLLIGQELYDPLDISVRMATWAENVSVPASEIAGEWQVTWIDDTNVGHNPHEPFDMYTQALTITDLGGGRVGVQPGFGGNTWVMQINGNVLEPEPDTIEPSLVHLSMKSDGQTIVIAAIGVESDDPTDVSPAIGFSTRSQQPLLHDWNGDGIVSIIGDVPPFVNCVYFQNCPMGVDTIAVGDCSGDGILSIVGDVPCFVNCVYFGKCPPD